MSDFKEFQASSIDAAMLDACTYFDVSREKLEVEIIQDAKSGIFGIVGARKAKIRARRASFREELESVLGKDYLRRSTPVEEEPAQELPSALQPFERHSVQGKKDTVLRPNSDILALFDAGSPLNEAEEPSEAAPADGGGPCSEETSRTPVQAGGRVFDATELEQESEDSGLPLAGKKAKRPDSKPLPDEELCSAVVECVRRLAMSLAGEDVLEGLCAEVKDGAVCVLVKDEGNCAPLIGKDGNVLASIQHLASLIVSKRFDASVRVRLDVGDYRQRQDEKLKAQALSLARKAVETGKVCSTRPLSAYQRRIVHLALQGQDGVQTRIVGDGGMRRVVFIKKRSCDTRG